MGLAEKEPGWLRAARMTENRNPFIRRKAAITT